MATITKMQGGHQIQRTVKNLGWFFDHARRVEIVKFDLWEANDGWEMFVDFADGWTYHVHYASFENWKNLMKRQRSLRGVRVTLHGSDGSTGHIQLSPRGVIGRAEGDHGGGYDWVLK